MQEFIIKTAPDAKKAAADQEREPNRMDSGPIEMAEITPEQKDEPKKVSEQPKVSSTAIAIQDKMKFAMLEKIKQTDK